MNFHTQSEVCSSKNGLVMSTLYICTFVLCSDSQYEILCEIWSRYLKKWACYAQFSNLCCPAHPSVSFVFEGFQIGSPSSSPDISGSRYLTKFVHPSKCCYQPGDSFKSSAHLLRYPRPLLSSLKQIYSFCFSPNLPGFKFVQYVVLLLKQKRCG